MTLIKSDKNAWSQLKISRWLVARKISVIPVSILTKKPTIRTWKEFQTRFPTDEELISWFGVGADVNIAIVTGAISGVVTCDGDSQEAEKWATDNLPDTPWRTRTPRGMHRHFQHPGGRVRNKCKLRTGDTKIDLDIRADGGYVIAPLSRHASGIDYQPEGDWSVSKDDLPIFPQELITSTAARSEPEQKSHPPAKHAIEVIDRARKYLAASPKPEIGQGSDDKTFIAACRATIGFGLTVEEASTLLWEWCGNRDGWTYEWVLKKVENAVKYGTETPGGLRDGAPASKQQGLTHFESDAVKGVVSNAVETPSTYRFESAFSADHFVTRFIDYASKRTDAAHEFAEATALSLLAYATPKLRAHFGPYPRGLPTNLYTLLIGESTVSRKTTSMGFGRHMLGTLDEMALLPDLASPEAFIEQLAMRSPDPAIWVVDEFGDLLEKLHHAKHMAGLRGVLLTLYGGTDYTYRRHSKRKKSGERVEDVDHIRSPHLNILGATTPAVFETLTARDVQTGFLARFAIVMPDGKPSRKKFHETAPSYAEDAEEIASLLVELGEWAGRRREIEFACDALETLDLFVHEVEKFSSGPVDPNAKTMVSRLPVIAYKLAILSAAGHRDAVSGHKLCVDEDDARAATLVATRWKRDSVRFAARVGENVLERTIEKCLAVLRKSKRRLARRRDIARAAHVEKKLLDSVEATLIDRGVITTFDRPNKNGVATRFWKLEGNH